jgi:pilus assembly protein CpaE
MAEVLGIEGVAGIPVDRVRLRNALNAGRPVMTERDGGAYAQALRRAIGRSAPVKGSFPGFGKMRRRLLQTVERAG